MAKIDTDMRSAHRAMYGVAQQLSPTVLRGLTLGDQKALIDQTGAALGVVYSTLLFAAKTNDGSTRGSRNSEPVTVKLAAELPGWRRGEMDAVLWQGASATFRIRAITEAVGAAIKQHQAALQARQPRDVTTSAQGRGIANDLRAATEVMGTVDRQIYLKALAGLDAADYAQFLIALRALVDCLRAILARLAVGVAYTYSNMGWPRHADKATLRLNEAARAASTVERRIGGLAHLVTMPVDAPAPERAVA